MRNANLPLYKKQRVPENPNDDVPTLQTNPRVNPPLQPGNNDTGRMHNHMFYKTRLCQKFNNGPCPYGDSCCYAHGLEDLRVPPPNWMECVREDYRPKGTSAGKYLAHTTKICNMFYRGGQCLFGESCKFLHERKFPSTFEGDGPSRRESSVNSIEVKKSEGGKHHIERESTVLRIGTSGHGWSSRDEQPKTKLCDNCNTCQYGEMCNYVHDTPDLKVINAHTLVEPPSNSLSTPVATLSFTVPNIPRTDLASSVDDEEEKRNQRWKIGKRINRVYGDWINDGSPPRASLEED